MSQWDSGLGTTGCTKVQVCELLALLHPSPCVCSTTLSCAYSNYCFFRLGYTSFGWVVFHLFRLGYTSLGWVTLV